jgi:TRAP-type C4-dicarboxylate transport system permease small subunit
MKTAQKVLAFIERVFVFVAGASMVLMMLLTTFDLLSRKFLDYSIPSLYEFTEDYLMVGLVFLTISYVYAQGGHVRVTLFEHLLPRRFRLVWEKLHQLMALVLFFFIAVKGWEAALRAYEFNEMSNSVLAYPLAPALMLVPVGSAMLCLRILQALFNQLKLQDAHDFSGAE